MKLSDQAVAAVMMALQKGIFEQTDITEVLKDFELICDDEGFELFVTNMPTIDPNLVNLEDDELEDEQQVKEEDKQ